VAAAAALATIAAGLAPAAAQVAPRGSAAPAVTHYKGILGVAHLVPRTVRHTTGSGPAPMFPKGARHLPGATSRRWRRCPPPSRQRGPHRRRPGHCPTSTAPAAGTASSPTTTRSSSHRTRGCVRPTRSCWSRSIPRTASAERTGSRSAGRPSPARPRTGIRTGDARGRSPARLIVLAGLANDPARQGTPAAGR
jgi:hypothetical protein